MSMNLYIMALLPLNFLTKYCDKGSEMKMCSDFLFIQQKNVR